MLFGNYNWPETGGNDTAVLECVHGRRSDGGSGGVAMRQCLIGGDWRDIDFSQCRDSEL